MTITLPPSVPTRPRVLCEWLIENAGRGDDWNANVARLLAELTAEVYRERLPSARPPSEAVGLLGRFEVVNEDHPTSHHALRGWTEHGGRDVCFDANEWDVGTLVEVRRLPSRAAPTGVTPNLEGDALIAAMQAELHEWPPSTKALWAAVKHVKAKAAVAQGRAAPHEPSEAERSIRASLSCIIGGFHDRTPEQFRADTMEFIGRMREREASHPPGGADPGLREAVDALARDIDASSPGAVIGRAEIAARLRELTGGAREEMSEAEAHRILASEGAAPPPQPEVKTAIPWDPACWTGEDPVGAETAASSMLDHAAELLGVDSGMIDGDVWDMHVHSFADKLREASSPQGGAEPGLRAGVLALATEIDETGLGLTDQDIVDKLRALASEGAAPPSHGLDASDAASDSDSPYAPRSEVDAFNAIIHKCKPGDITQIDEDWGQCRKCGNSHPLTARAARMPGAAPPQPTPEDYPAELARRAAAEGAEEEPEGSGVPYAPGWWWFGRPYNDGDPTPVQVHALEDGELFIGAGHPVSSVRFAGRWGGKVERGDAGLRGRVEAVRAQCERDANSLGAMGGEAASARRYELNRCSGLLRAALEES